jgi:CMP-N,N'-diacetyllegionaminic acid synthase
MRILALIPARGGSKRLPGKNIRPLGGKPMITWSIEVAKEAPSICDVLVSTDDPSIAALCIDAGCFVPWLRPAELATDEASSVDVALHALNWYEAEKGSVDGLLLLQPTSPFRTRKSICRGIDLFLKHEYKPVLAVSVANEHPMWAMKMKNEYLEPYLSEHGIGMRSQDLPQIYTINGSFYLISPAELRAKRSFVGEKTIPLLIESQLEMIDIDTEWDFEIAQLLIKKNEIKNKIQIA